MLLEALTFQYTTGEKYVHSILLSVQANTGRSSQCSEHYLQTFNNLYCADAQKCLRAILMAALTPQNHKLCWGEGGGCHYLYLKILEF